jgi:serine/threonine protein kinase
VDVYQMGLILVELLTGKPVVQGENQYACAHKHIQGDLKFPADLLEGPLGPVLLKATALDPGDRYPNAQEFRKALLSISPGEPSPRRQDALPLHWAVAALTVSVFGLLLVIAVIAVVWWAKTPQPVDSSLENPITTAPLAPTLATAPPVAQTPPPVPLPVAEPSPGPAPAVEQAPTSTLINTDPSGATVKVKDTNSPLGESPVEFTWAKGQEEVTLVIRKKGFKNKDFTLRRMDKPPLLIKLEEREVRKPLPIPPPP